MQMKVTRAAALDYTFPQCDRSLTQSHTHNSNELNDRLKIDVLLKLRLSNEKKKAQFWGAFRNKEKFSSLGHLKCKEPACFHCLFSI